jgi:hypothetical protein
MAIATVPPAMIKLLSTSLPRCHSGPKILRKLSNVGRNITDRLNTSAGPLNAVITIQPIGNRIANSASRIAAHSSVAHISRRRRALARRRASSDAATGKSAVVALMRERSAAYSTATAP